MELFALIVGVWVSLGISRFLTMHPYLIRRAELLLWILKDMGLTDRQIDEAGFTDAIEKSASVTWGLAGALVTAPYTFASSPLGYFMEPNDEALHAHTVDTLVELVHTEGTYVDTLRLYDEECASKVVLH